MMTISRFSVWKDSANQAFVCNFLLTKIVARKKLFSPHCRHNFSRVCGFPTLVDNPTTNTMRRQPRRGGVALWRFKMKRFVFAFAALAAMTAPGAAADLARRGPYYPAPAPVYAPIFNWTGFYIGVNGGGGFGSSNWDSTAAGTSAAA
jgi:hypothetical protein